MGGFDPTSFMGSSGVTNQYIQNQQIQEYLDSLNNPTNRYWRCFYSRWSNG